MEIGDGDTMSWDEVLKKKRCGCNAEITNPENDMCQMCQSRDALKKKTNVSESGVVPVDNVLDDHKELGRLLSGVIGAVGGLKDNMPIKTSEVRNKLAEIKEEINKIRSLLTEMDNSYTDIEDDNWQKTMEDWD